MLLLLLWSGGVSASATTTLLVRRGGRCCYHDFGSETGRCVNLYAHAAPQAARTAERKGLRRRGGGAADEAAGRASSPAIRAGRCFRFEGAHRPRPACRHRCNATKQRPRMGIASLTLPVIRAGPDGAGRSCCCQYSAPEGGNRRCGVGGAVALVRARRARAGICGLCVRVCVCVEGGGRSQSSRPR